MICENCQHEIEPVLFRGWNAGGMKQVVKKCPLCKDNVKKSQAFYSYKDYDFDSLPILYDERTRHKCAVEGCENYIEEGTMNHHFFPKYLFGVELAERAPQAYLCKTHHMDEWHAKLTPNMTKKELD
jgi:hypothetical protein